jgi:hypothetical protein
MKKNEKIRLVIGAVLFMIILILFSQCVGSKKVIDKKTSLVETVTEISKKDSSAVTIVNKPIDDSFKIFVPEINDVPELEYIESSIISRGSALDMKGSNIISPGTNNLVFRDQHIQPVLTLTPEQLKLIDIEYSKKNAELLNKELNRILSSINTNKKSGKNSYSVKWNKVTRTIDVDVTIGETVSIETNNSDIKKADSKSELITFESVYKKVTLIPWWIWLIAAIVFLPTIMKLFLPHISALSKLIPRNT